MKPAIALFALTLLTACSAWPPPASQSDSAAQAALIDDLLKLPAGREERKRRAPLAGLIRTNVNAPPGEDAPLHILAGFWDSKGDGRWRFPLPEKTRERLLEASLDQPWHTPYLVEFLPRTPATLDRIKRFYDEEQSLFPSDKERLRTFLMQNTAHFRDELIRQAARATDHRVELAVNHDDDLEALAALDFQRAEPLLRRFAADAMPRRAVVSKALLFAYGPSGPDIERLNLELRKVVEDPGADGYSRGRALEGLVARDWPGRDPWFIDLFRDVSIGRPLPGRYPPLVEVVARDPDRWIPQVAKLVGNRNPAVHDNAVRCLALFLEEGTRRDAIMPLLPWLLDPQWFSAEKDIFPNGRYRLIQSVVNLEIRESIPGLIAVLSQDVKPELRAVAAEALGYFKAQAAAPALRQALSRISNDRRPHGQSVVRALVSVGGLSDSEMALAIDAFASQESPRSSIPEFAREQAQGSLPDPITLGGHLAYNCPLSEGAIALLLARSAELEPQDLPTASRLLNMAHRCPSVAGDRDIALRIAANTATADSIQSALLRRETFARNASDVLRASVSSSGASTGILAMLSGDADRERRVLSGSDSAAIRALLASARAAGAPLPFDAVERVYNSRDTNAAGVAEIYLVSNDGPRAREILNARAKGTVIFGAQEPGRNIVNPFNGPEEKLLAMTKGDQAADEVFALLTAYSPSGNTEQIVIQRRGDTATLTYEGFRMSSKSRALTPEELRRLQGLIERETIDDLSPILNRASDLEVLVEYVHLTRTSGRRVYMSNHGGLFEEPGYSRIQWEFSRLAELRYD